MTDRTPKEFPSAAVLSVVAGPLLCDIGDIYELLGWMTGESPFTHQLPRVASEATPVILALHPELQQAVDEAEAVNRDNWQQWLSTWVERYGETITVPKLTIAEHERIDPLSELAEKVHPDRIAIVKVGD